MASLACVQPPHSILGEWGGCTQGRLRKLEPLINHSLTTNNIMQYITLHKASQYQQWAAEHAQRTVERSNKHPHKF